MDIVGTACGEEFLNNCNSPQQAGDPLHLGSPARPKSGPARAAMQPREGPATGSPLRTTFGGALFGQRVLSLHGLAAHAVQNIRHESFGEPCDEPPDDRLRI
jgi:hypothetical protein